VLDLRGRTTSHIPRALADAYDANEVGAQLLVRFATAVDRDLQHDLITGGGFVTVGARRADRSRRIERARTLPDRVGPHLRVLLCGLNPSLYAADIGVGFARPGNRFWPAALASGLLTADRDPRDALDSHNVGMTDLVKRATARADELERSEYVAGAARVARLCHLVEPRVLCVVGLTGWRIGVDKLATTGPQAEAIGTTLVYVMPNPSGLNAHVTVADLAEHFRIVGALADRG
jgi:TDG/mug DNA glycosylase family protein